MCIFDCSIHNGRSSRNQLMRLHSCPVNQETSGRDSTSPQGLEQDPGRDRGPEQGLEPALDRERVSEQGLEPDPGRDRGPEQGLGQTNVESKDLNQDEEPFPEEAADTNGDAASSISENSPVHIVVEGDVPQETELNSQQEHKPEDNKTRVKHKNLLLPAFNRMDSVEESLKSTPAFRFLTRPDFYEYVKVRSLDPPPLFITYMYSKYTNIHNMSHIYYYIFIIYVIIVV